MLQIDGSAHFIETHALLGFRVAQALGTSGTIVLELHAKAAQKSSVFHQLSQLQRDIGTQVTCSLGNWSFTGVIDKISCVHNAQFFEVTVRDPLDTLEMKWDSRVFTDRKISEIVKSVVSPEDSCEFVGSIGDTKVPLAIQYQEPVAEFLHHLLGEHGAVIWCSGGKIYVGNEPHDETLDMNEGSDLIPMRVESGGGVESVSVQGINYGDANRLQQYVLENPASSGGLLQSTATDIRAKMNESAQLHITREYLEQETAESFAATLLRFEAQSRLSLAAEVRKPVPLGVRIKLVHDGADGNSQEEEPLVVTQLMGYWSAGMAAPTWECWAVPAEGFTNNRPAAPRSMRYSPGVVENTAENTNRVQIRFPWDREKTITPWLRMIALAWGKEHMVYLPPKNGDTVLVAWGQNDADPVVLGVLASGDAIDRAEANFVFMSGVGHRVSVDDETIRIENAAGGKGPTSVEIGADHVSVETSGGHSILINDDAICLKHRKGGEVHLDAGKLTLVSDGDVEIKNGGGATLVLSGPTVNVNGGALEVT
ncbi:MAG: hypothetical protein JXM70_08785 [Pirellulales bacterium]|nr:hypothetical protein [Pirellulales bacterium]